MPKISPARTLKLMSRKAPALDVSAVTSSTTRGAGGLVSGNMRSTLRPTISSTSTLTGSCADSWRATSFPSRSTITRSAMRAISSSRWLM
jgi:hypothetical protein